MKSIILIGLCFSSIAFAKQTKQFNLNSLKQTLQETNAGWEADDAWVNKHSKAEIKRMLGLKHVQSTDVEFEVPTNQLRSEIAPTVLDWRNISGVNYVSPVLDQGNCGSCVAFASVATFETQMNITAAGSALRFSPQNLFSCGGGACDYGWDLGPASDYLKTTGVPDEACDPYISGATGTDVACSAACSDVKARSVKIVSYSQPTSYNKNLDAIRAALAKGPLMTSLNVYTDFLFYKSGVYKHVTGNMEGGHAVSIVGYDDKLQAFIIRNSWSQDWGMNGFAYVSYSDISGVGDETFLYEAPKLNGFVSVRNPMNQMIVSGQLNVQTESNYAQLQKVDQTIVNNQMQIQSSSSCALSKCSEVVDTTKMADGRYEIFATAYYGSGQKSESQHEYFYIVNNAPALKLSFEGKASLTAPVSGRIEFNIHGQSGVSPFSLVSLIVKSGSQIVYTKNAANVLPEMTMGWRTNVLPNGKYEIYLIGKLNIGDKAYSTESNHFTVNVAN